MQVNSIFSTFHSPNCRLGSSKAARMEFSPNHAYFKFWMPCHTSLTYWVFEGNNTENVIQKLLVVPTSSFKHCLHRTSTRNAWQSAVVSGIWNNIFSASPLPTFILLYPPLSVMLGTESRSLHMLGKPLPWTTSLLSTPVTSKIPRVGEQIKTVGFLVVTKSECIRGPSTVHATILPW